MRLTVRHLAKAYGLLWALKDVGLDLSAGEIVALLGPNGAGKTTLLKLLAGLISPTTGEILLDGSSFSRSAAVQRSTVGFLTPGEHLYEDLTVRENLDFLYFPLRQEPNDRPNRWRAPGSRLEAPLRRIRRRPFQRDEMPSFYR